MNNRYSLSGSKWSLRRFCSHTRFPNCWLASLYHCFLFSFGAYTNPLRFHSILRATKRPIPARWSGWFGLRSVEPKAYLERWIAFGTSTHCHSFRHIRYRLLSEKRNTGRSLAFAPIHWLNRVNGYFATQNVFLVDQNGAKIHIACFRGRLKVVCAATNSVANDLSTVVSRFLPFQLR